jgi:hypothetical protein
MIIRLAIKEWITVEKALELLHTLIESTNFRISSKTFGEALIELEKLRK